MECYSGVLQLSPAAESPAVDCPSLESCSGVLLWRVLLVESPVVESCHGVLHLSPTVECPVV